jgi:far upstream element-binding protein
MNLADPTGIADRTFTISGSKEAIGRCRKMIDDIIKRGGNQSSPADANGMMRGNLDVVEINLPGNKCGLVIGKGGETIKKLSEDYGVKLVVVQETNTPSGSDKPLRITGEPDKVAKAKEAVLELIRPIQRHNDYGSRDDRDGDRGGRGGDRGGRDDRDRRDGGYRNGDRRDDRGDRRDDRGSYGGGGGGGAGGGGYNSQHGRPSNECSVKVPGDRAGLVIGKG